MENSKTIKLAATSWQEEISVRGGIDRDLQDAMRDLGYGAGFVTRVLVNIVNGLANMFSSCERRA
jgi:hypothetical protein